MVRRYSHLAEKIADPAKPSKFSAVQDVLSSALKRYGLEDKIARYQFVLHWKDIVGEEIAKRAVPECLRGGTLVVRVSNSVWAQELTFQKEVIIKRLQKFLGSDEMVNDVSFYVGAKR